MSYSPFLEGPGRKGDFVKLNGNIYKISHVEDFLSPRIGWDGTDWSITAFTALAARGDTTHRNLAITNVAELRLLQVCGVEISSPFLRISMRQPAKMTRWGAGDVPEGEISGFQSPLGSPIRLRNLFSVNEKPLQMRGQNVLVAHTIIPRVMLRGFLYELEAGPTQVSVFFEPPIGGIE